MEVEEQGHRLLSVWPDGKLCVLRCYLNVESITRSAYDKLSLILPVDEPGLIKLPAEIWSGPMSPGYRLVPWNIDNKEGLQ